MAVSENKKICDDLCHKRIFDEVCSKRVSDARERWAMGAAVSLTLLRGRGR